MKKTTAITLIIVFSIFFLLIGIYSPLTEILISSIDQNEKVSIGDMVYYTICTVQAIATVLAVLVALFSDDIKHYLHKPQLNFSMRSNHILEELDPTENKTRVAKSYHNRIDIENIGKANAEECQAYIESVRFKGIGGQSYVEIFSGESHIVWNGIDGSRNATTYIPPKGKKSFRLYEIMPPQEGSTPDGKISNSIPRLQIPGVEIPAEYCGGEWIITIIFFSRLITPKHLSITINWNGRWEQREMEMKKHISNTLNTIEQ
jgi:hypothetical protein